MTNAPKLLPCPFCGGEAEHSVGKTGDGNPWHYVECVECGAAGPNSPYADHNIAVVQFRAEAWNRRAPDPRVAALVEAARKMVQAYRDETDGTISAFYALESALAAFKGGADG